MQQMRFLIIALLMSVFLPLSAQHDNEVSEFSDTVAPTTPEFPSLPIGEVGMPRTLLTSPGWSGASPWCGDDLWSLHQGFNARFSLGLSVGLGKGAPRGVGFAQSAAFAYAAPLTSRLSLAAGIYADNMDWGAFRRTDVGLAAALRYRVNERIGLYAYATKSFFSDRSLPPGPFPLYDYPVRDRIGAMAEFKLGEKAIFQISVERSSLPSQGWGIPPVSGNSLDDRR